jgi:hypothetical protein
MHNLPAIQENRAESNNKEIEIFFILRTGYLYGFYIQLDVYFYHYYYYLQSHYTYNLLIIIINVSFELVNILKQDAEENI